jgi:glycine/D-amino acid oxidase-like deaminating enzyme
VTVIVLGVGIFGVTAALALRRRGHRVISIDPGPLPHPLAASTDISKAIRLEYGADEEYVALGERAIDGWRRWNADGAPPLYHETGTLFLRRTPLEPGGFEHDSLALLARRGHRPERVGTAEVRARFPAWNAAAYPDGIFHAVGGWAESGKVVARLLQRAQAEGVELREAAVVRLLEAGSKIAGVLCADGVELRGDRVILAAGSWTPHLLPHTARFFRSQGMPVFHLRPADPSLFAGDRFPVFGADISETGYYGFPLHPEAGVVKIANHGPGRALHPESPARVVTEAETAALRAFLAGTFPALADAPIVSTRVCLYCDTWDGHFWIAPDPDRDGLVLATGGSGHGFKFAPVLGDLIADAAEGRENAWSRKFRWRPEVRPARAEEAARHQE